jgi:uncharacterized protein YqfB (UPF0267 family)
VKFVIVLAGLGFLSSCVTLEGRFAQRTGCKKDTITVRNTSASPVHNNWLVVCGAEKKEFICTDTPVYQSCSEKTSEEQKPANPEK